MALNDASKRSLLSYRRTSNFNLPSPSGDGVLSKEDLQHLLYGYSGIEWYDSGYSRLVSSDRDVASIQCGVVRNMSFSSTAGEIAYIRAQVVKDGNLTVADADESYFNMQVLKESGLVSSDVDDIELAAQIIHQTGMFVSEKDESALSLQVIKLLIMSATEHETSGFTVVKFNKDVSILEKEKGIYLVRTKEVVF